MGESPVELGERELKKIGEYVKAHLPEWLGELRRDREIELTERIVRVEEEVKSLREVMEGRFEAMESHFESRFEAMESRFESRYEAVDSRFDALESHVESRFEAIDARFEAVDTRFDSMESRFETRFEEIDKRFTHMQWTIGLGFTLLAMLMGVFNFL
jgi:flagellar capping protein FliD